MAFVPYKLFVKALVDEINHVREEATPEGEDFKPISPKVVREVLEAFDVGFIELREGDQIKTPFGVFTMTYQKAREVTLPNQKQKAIVPEKLVVRFNPGKRLQFPLSDGG